MIGQTVANYRILEPLEHSGQGEVYLAQDTELDRKAVLKFLPEDAGSEPETQERFVREAKSAASLHHPNIVTIYKVGEHSGRPYVAMEYVEGRTLAEMISEGSIAQREAINIAIQICAGVSEAHKNHIVHRNIRPEAILIGHGGRARIADFGFATGAAASSSGARAFQSPERARGEAGDERSDVYSIGVLFNKMNTGDQFTDIVTQAISERPEDRHATVDALGMDLVKMRSRLYGDASKPMPGSRAMKPFIIATLLVLAVAYIIVVKPFNRGAPSDEESTRQIIAVLPFENLGGANDEYFADGITDEITSRVALVQGLGVISRTSARVYKNTDKSVREIGNELNADYIIEGTIRWDRSSGMGRVRITPQLIRVSDDTHVWANTYEREITEIFAVQADIATHIAEALDVTLLENERRALTAAPTENIDAYHAYLQGMKCLDAPDFDRELFESGVLLFERAATLDPAFALAYARLSSMHSRIVHYGYDRTDQRQKTAKAAVDRAFSLQPDLPEAHLALGYYYYWVHRDYDLALVSLETARELNPNSSEILQATAYVKRRQGNLVECAELLERDLGLSPLDATAAVALGETYGTLRRYSDGERSLKHGISLAPDNYYPYTELALLYLRWRGDTAAARATLDQMPSEANSESHRARFLVELLNRNYTAALRYIDTCPDRVLEAAAFFVPAPLLEGETFQLMGDTTRAAKAFEESRMILENKLAEAPDDYRVHSALGITYAGLGRAQDAVRHGERAVELYPVSRDALEAPLLIMDLALTYTMVGKHDEALERLDYVLSIPSILSAPWIEKDPRWDPLRQHPQFASLSRNRGSSRRSSSRGSTPNKAGLAPGFGKERR
jgi:TolB-like protein/Flp pilus assembly protein TadD